ncbi:ribosome maturation factor RimM [Chloroflexota bacterium]
MNQAATRPKTEDDKRGSGGQGRAPEPRFLVVGQVLGAHGLRGELKVRVLTDDPLRFRRLQQVFLGLDDRTPVPWTVRGSRLHKGNVLLMLEGCNDRTTVETLRGFLVHVPLEEALSLEEGEYYEHQIVGLEVWTVAGEELGTVAEIIFTGANEVYVVRGDSRNEILVPAIESVVLEVDLETERILIELPEELR